MSCLVPKTISMHSKAFCHSKDFVMECAGVQYTVNGMTTPWVTILPMLSILQRCHFATMQGSIRKDVKRAFGVLLTRRAIVSGAAMVWDSETLWDVVTCCVILHTNYGGRLRRGSLHERSIWSTRGTGGRGARPLQNFNLLF